MTMKSGTTTSARGVQRAAVDQAKSLLFEVERLTLQSSDAAETLCRLDEAAYMDACDRGTHVLKVKMIKGPTATTVGPKYILLMQAGEGMKVQRREILAKLGKAEEKRQHIGWELSVATEKIADRSRRMGVAKAAWGEWCTTKGNAWDTALDAVLSSASGRRAWRDHMQDTREKKKSQSAGGKHDSHAIISPCEPERPVELEEEENKMAGTERRSQEDFEDTNAATSLVKLHLALESLIQHAEDRGDPSDVNVHECAELCAEWSRDDLSETFDTSLLHPVRSLAAVSDPDENKREVTSVYDLHPLRKALRLVMQRSFFGTFFSSSGGQTFLLDAVQDGTIESTMAQHFVTDLTAGAYFDEDAQGFRRIVAHGDDWMHSRLFHEGVEQRIRVEVAESWLQTMLDGVYRLISGYRGELAVVVQHVYSLAALQLQPVFRGVLTRMAVLELRREFMSCAFLSAAVDIQRMVRGNLARSRVRDVFVMAASRSLVSLQARIRGFIVRRRILRKWQDAFDRQAIAVQRIYRGHLCRVALRASSTEKAWTQKVELHGWAISVIQRQWRMWLARRRVELKRIEIGLTSRVSEMADRLATAEDSRSVSAVISEVDRDYRRYEQALGEMQIEEDEMATTFVKKVLERRDGEIASAWKSFASAAACHAARVHRKSQARRVHPLPASRQRSSGVSEHTEDRLHSLIARYTSPTQARHLPSAYLRDALPAHVKLNDGERSRNGTGHSTKAKGGESGQINVEDGWYTSHRVVSKFNGRSKCNLSRRELMASFRQRQLHRDTTSVVPLGVSGMDTSTTFTPATDITTLTLSNTFRSSQSCTPCSRTSEEKGSAALRDDGMKTEHRSFPASDGLLQTGSTFRGERGAKDLPGEDDNSSDLTKQENDWRAGWNYVWDVERRSRGLTGDGCSRFPGSSVRHDVPSGLDETVERLLAAAFLRGHVPKQLMPTGTTAIEAYSRFLALPPSLAKIRHEQLCREASQPVAALLRSRGFTSVRQLLPPSKLEHLLRETGTSQGEIYAAVSIVREINPASSPPRTRGVCAGNNGGYVIAASGARALFSPLPSSTRKGLVMGRTTRGGFGDGDEGSRDTGTNIAGSFGGNNVGGEKSIVAVGETLKWGGTKSRDGTRTSPHSDGRRKAQMMRVDNLGLGGGPVANEGTGDGWEPRRYTSNPAEWMKPPPSVIHRRWDDETKTFVRRNQYSFDSAYRKYHPQDGIAGSDKCDGRSGEDFSDTDHNARCGWFTASATAGKEDKQGTGMCPPRASLSRARQSEESVEAHTKCVVNTPREAQRMFFSGCRQSMRELYHDIVNDVASWGSVEDPIDTLLCKAAFHVIDHPSPATRTELMAAREKDRLSKGQINKPPGGTTCGGKENKLAEPIRLAEKIARGKFEQKTMEASLAGVRVPLGREAFREFIKQLDSTTENTGDYLSPSSSNSTNVNQQVSERTADKVLTEDLPKVNDPVERVGNSTRPGGGRYGSALPDRRRTLLSRRLEAAEMLARPFAVRLEADGVTSVKVLARVPDLTWGLPSCLVEEVERMLGLLAVKTCCAPDDYRERGRKNNLTSQKAIGAYAGTTVRQRSRLCHGRARVRRWGQRPRRTLDFDPRFQRSALDPRGRPARIESIRPCRLTPTLAVAGGRHILSEDDDDLPPGLWEHRLLPAAKRKVTAKGTIGCESKSKSSQGMTPDVEDLQISAHCNVKRVLETSDKMVPTHSAAFSLSLSSTRDQHTKREHDRPQASEKMTASSSRYTCSVPRCGATFTRSVSCRTHERSHDATPGYHRHRHAPQLFRDPPPAPCEGTGARAEKFRLRTELPESVQRELDQLQAESATRRRCSLLAVPGLPGATATWAGVAMPGRNLGGAVV